MSRLRLPGFGIWLLCQAITCASAAPLTLEQVLEHARLDHPDLNQAQAYIGLAQAEQLSAESLADLRLTIDGSLRGGRSELTDNKFEPDHQLRLNARKILWDAGRIDANTAAARLESASRTAQYAEVVAQRRQTLMARYFDVLLTDMQYAADNEYMAVAYVSWDNAKERQQLGELSVATLAELEARFQETRARRNDSLRRVREKRALLASAMNRPGDLAADLTDPELTGNDRPIPEFDPLLALLREHNPRLQALRQQIAASGKRFEAAQSDNRPTLEFETEIAAYSRDTYTRDNLRAGLNLVWPLYQGGQNDARRAREIAQGQILQTQYDASLLNLRQALYETREEILFLRETERKAADVNSAYRDWSLEKARAEYELEMKTNLGNSMADTQAAKLRRRAVEFRLAMAWERLAGLLGVPLETLKMEAHR
jgi:outer membrane protein TolC